MDIEHAQREPTLGAIDQVPVSLDPSTDDDPFLTFSTPEHRTPFAESILFFVSAVGCTIGCTAVLSNLVYYSDTLGLDSFLLLNVAVFAPMFPVTLSQAIWDAKFDRRFQSLRSFLFRGSVGFSITLLCLLLLPWASQSLFLLSITSVFLGLSSAVLHGMLKQMASFVYPHCGRSSAAVNAGMQASGLIVLAVSVTYGFGGCTNKEGLYWFYNTISAILIVCWACCQVLLMCSQGVTQSMQRRDAINLSPEMEEPLLSPSRENDSNDQHESIIPQGSMELSFATLWNISWPVCVVIIFTVGSSMSVSSWFNRVESQDPTNTSFPQVLFYTRLLADLLGRPVTLFAAPKAIVTLNILSLTRLSFVPIFFLYTSTNLIPKSDIWVVVGVFAFSFSSGYLVTLSYQLAPTLLIDHDRERNLMKQTNLINVCFSAAVLLGLTSSIVLMGVMKA
jgi:Nucleoside transporter